MVESTLSLTIQSWTKSTGSLSGPFPRWETFSPSWMVNNIFQHWILARCHHIPLYNTSIPKTAFTWPFGKYEYLKVPFGLAQAPAYFQELMNKVLKDLPFAIAYLDDIIIYHKITEHHLDHLQQVFHILWNATLSMKLSKCHYFAKEIQYLGHILSATSIKHPDQKQKLLESYNQQRMPNSYQFPWSCGPPPQMYLKFCSYGKTTHDPYVSATTTNVFKIWLIWQNHSWPLCIIMQNLTWHWPT